MKSILLSFFVCLLLLPLGVFGQERIQKVMVGPASDRTRILMALIDQTEEGFKTQSMIIDLNPIKDKKEKPQSVLVDLTSTVRSLATGKKDQKILILTWNEKDELEMKCNGNWTKQDFTAASQKIVDTTKEVIQNVPVNAKEASEVTLSKELIKKIEAVLGSLSAENFKCLRTETGN